MKGNFYVSSLLYITVYNKKHTLRMNMQCVFQLAENTLKAHSYFFQALPVKSSLTQREKPDSYLVIDTSILIL